MACNTAPCRAGSILRGFSRAQSRTAWRKFASAAENMLQDALHRCRGYLERVDYRGYDPYDALLAPMWRAPLLRSARLLRRCAQQVLLRLPWNLRPLLGIPPGEDPVTLALALRGYAALWQLEPARRPLWEQRLEELLLRLQRLRSPGWNAAWGYHFPWEARRMSLGAWEPTIVATGIVTDALFRLATVLGWELPALLCRNAAEELCERFPTSINEPQRLCWAYSPHDRQQVLNATLFGARLCAQAVRLGAPVELLGIAERAVRFVVEHQLLNGAFPYAAGGDPRTWVDHFHTGYVLECLHAYEALTGDHRFHSALERGWEFYRRHLFTPEGIPRWSSRRRYPVDATACAEAIIVLSRFGALSAAHRVARWAVQHLQLPDGAFAYRRYRFWTVRIRYLRWSVAPMFAALAELLCCGDGAAHLD
jgi:hypothetical protein